MRYAARLWLAFGCSSIAVVASCGLDSTGSLFENGSIAGASSTGASVGAGGSASASAGAGGENSGIGGAGMGGMASAGAGGESSGAGGSPPTAICGDGKVEGPIESCDDSNTSDADGCSSKCMTEPSGKCPGNTVVLTPAGAIIKGNLGAQSDMIDPRCGPDGLKDTVYAVTPTVSGTMTATLILNGDKSISILSGCPGTAPGVEVTCRSGMSDQAQPLWVFAGKTYIVVVDGPEKDDYELKLELTMCGDNVVDGDEQCDKAGDAACIGCVLCNGPGEFMDPASKHCYRLVDTAKSWQDARDYCIAWGGDLAGIHDKAEFDFLAANMAPPIAGDTWVGGYATTPLCSYGWVNGEPWHSEWANNEPNTAGDACVQLWQAQGKRYDDTGCAGARSFLCERTPAGGCGDGIVQPGEGCDDKNTNDGDGCSAACQPDVPCSSYPGFFEFGNPKHCYWVPPTQANWDASRLACNAQGGYLVAIESQAENDAINQKIKAESWIGGWEGGVNDGSLVWETTTTSCGYKNWENLSDSDSAEDCARMINGSGKWRDAGCNLNFASVCERSY